MICFKYVTNRFFLLLALLSAAGYSQSKGARQLSISDYAKWSNLISLGMSEDGKWTSYASVYEDGNDTLFVKRTLGKKTFRFPKGKDGTFLSKKLFACVLSGDRLSITDLDNETVRTVQDVGHFSVLPGSGLLLAEIRKQGILDIRILDSSGRIFWEARGILGYALDRNFAKIAYSVFENGRGSVYISDLGISMKPQAVASLDGKLENLTWHGGGKALAFLGKSAAAGSDRFQADRLCYYSLASGKLKVLDTRQHKQWPAGREIALAGRDNFELSDDGMRVFFPMQKIPRDVPEADSDVQFWNTLDRRLHIVRQYGEWDHYPVLAQWEVASDSLTIIADGANTLAILAGNQKYALVYDGIKYEPADKMNAVRDIYIKEIATGETRLLLEKHSGDHSSVSISPAGRYVAYFSDGDWWAYSIADGRHLRASSKESASLGRRDYDFPGEAEPAAGVVWTPGDEALVYCDQNDIWRFRPADGTRKRLTRGRESGVEYRFIDLLYDARFPFQKAPVADLAKGAVVKGVSLDYGSSGYFRLTEKKLEPIVQAKGLVSALRISEGNRFFSYKHQDAGSPPRIMFQRTAASRPAVAAATNLQHYEFGLGGCELLQYGHKGLARNALLFYPADYDPSKKYPMVVHVYDKQAYNRSLYVNPSMYSQTGFNSAVMTSQGYFVLLPDIHYTVGSVGLSAIECVTAAVREALAWAPIDEKKIGLVGASFGGYESSFIITQTDMFAAAVAGSSMSDFVSASLAIHPNTIRSDMWRYENHQPRMGTDLYGNFEGYLENSPIRHAQSVATPLLLWAGTSDGQVPPTQSMEMYLALRQLKKESMLLLYEGELHGMGKRKNQFDLSLRILEWFGHYLKGEPKPLWAVPSEN